jgi:hypothetical protein
VLRGDRVSAYLLLTGGLVAASVAGLEYAQTDKNRQEIVLSATLALLFFCIGGLREYGWVLRARDPSVLFARMFRLKAASRRPTTFAVVIPQFRISGSSDASIGGLLYNPTIGRDTPIVVDEMISRNDSRTGGRIGSVIAGMTNGIYRPEFVGDDQLDTALLDAPSVVVGSYSNSWVRSYWNHCEQSGRRAIFGPSSNHGFIVHPEDGDRELLPEDAAGTAIANFYDSDKPQIEWDYGVFARVRGYSAKDANWLVCAGIGSAATDGIGIYLSTLADGRFPNLWYILEHYKDVDEFVVVFRVSARYVHNVTEVMRLPAPRVRRPTRLPHQRGSEEASSHASLIGWQDQANTIK